MYLAIEGRARVASEFNEQVWTAMINGERQQDPEQQGVAVVIEVDSVAGATTSQARALPSHGRPFGARRTIVRSPHARS